MPKTAIQSGNQRSVLFAGQSGRLLISLALAWTLIRMGRFLLPPLLPAMISELGLTLAKAGLLLTVLDGSYAVLQYPSGRYSDQLSRATLIVPGLFTLVFGFIFIVISPNYYALVLAMIILGAGQGLFSIPARALISDLYTEQRGRALGVFLAGSDLGGLLASGGAIFFLSIAMWRLSFLTVTLVLVPLTILFIYWNPEPYVVKRAELGVKHTFKRVFATREQLEAVIAFMLFFFMVKGVSGFLPAYLQAAKGFTPTLSSFVFALLFVGGIVAKPVGGAISDRFPRRLISVSGLLLGVLSLSIIIATESTLVIALAVSLLGVGYKMQFPILDAILIETAPDANAGGDLGAARSFFFAFSSLSPVYIGIIAQSYNYFLAFTGLVVALLSSATILATQWYRTS